MKKLAVLLGLAALLYTSNCDKGPEEARLKEKAPIEQKYSVAERKYDAAADYARIRSSLKESIAKGDSADLYCQLEEFVNRHPAPEGDGWRNGPDAFKLYKLQKGDHYLAQGLSREAKVGYVLTAAERTNSAEAKKAGLEKALNIFYNDFDNEQFNLCNEQVMVSGAADISTYEELLKDSRRLGVSDDLLNGLETYVKLLYDFK